ncbi:MAG: L-ribulose-5-phosphate 4-epimerase [Deinococcales bacterium]
MTLDELKRSVAELHALLPANGLVAWTSGNISGRLEGSRSMVIKPSGVAYEDLTASSMCVVTVDDLEVEGGLKPSSDTATHAVIYREMPEVGGIVHTHSAYATAFAALGREIPCVLTAMADEFGGPIPCGGFARIGGEEIGQEVVRVLTGHRSPAVLLQSHGVFTIGRTPRDAVKAAVMCEDVARTVHHALQLGTPLPLTQDDIDALHERYTNVYGQ